MILVICCAKICRHNIPTARHFQSTSHDFSSKICTWHRQSTSGNRIHSLAKAHQFHFCDIRFRYTDATRHGRYRTTSSSVNISHHKGFITQAGLNHKGAKNLTFCSCEVSLKRKLLVDGSHGTHIPINVCTNGCDLRLLGFDFSIFSRNLGINIIQLSLLLVFSSIRCLHCHSLDDHALLCS